MRDLVVREGLEAMALDAAERLRELVAVGEEIPYEVREPGDGSPLCRYEPLTERFVRDHASELRELDSFGAACAAIEIAGLAAPYLERMGIGVPDDPRKRAELAVHRLPLPAVDGQLRLLARAPTASTPRSTRSRQGSTSTPARSRSIVPLRGLQMPVARLELDRASIVRADTVEVPAEARSSDGLGVSPWEPTFLAVVRVERASRRRRPSRRRRSPPSKPSAA